LLAATLAILTPLGAIVFLQSQAREWTLPWVTVSVETDSVPTEQEALQMLRNASLNCFSNSMPTLVSVELSSTELGHYLSFVINDFQNPPHPQVDCVSEALVGEPLSERTFTQTELAEYISIRQKSLEEDAIPSGIIFDSKYLDSWSKPYDFTRIYVEPQEIAGEPYPGVTGYYFWFWFEGAG